MGTKSALLRLGRALRYRELPIIGQTVVIEHLEQVDEVLQQLGTGWMVPGAMWSGCDIMGGLAKYGLIDRVCNADPRLLEGALQGMNALRVNGLGSSSATEPEDADAVAIASDFLNDLAMELDSCVLKLFLHDDMSREARMEYLLPRLKARLPLELPPGYFPRVFTVTDACVTNAPSIWFSKHFYM